MTLRPTSETGAADWFASADTSPATTARLGPSVFPSYVRVHVDPQVDGRSERDVYMDLVEVLATSTDDPDDVWFGLWDGWGDLDGTEAAGLLKAVGDGAWFGRIFTPAKPPQAPPAFGPDVMDGPRVHLGDERAYLLFRGPLADAGAWGARPIAAGWPPRDISEPNLMWSSDRSWFVANDPETDWFGVGGSPGLVDALLGRTDLRTEATVHPTTSD